MARKKRGQTRDDVQSRKGDGRTEPQSPRQPCAGATGGEVSLVRFFDRAGRALIEILSGFGHRQAPRGSEQQAHTEPVLELSHRLGYRRLTDPELTCRG
jgi:hypothetical protein